MCRRELTQRRNREEGQNSSRVAEWPKGIFKIIPRNFRPSSLSRIFVQPRRTLSFFPPSRTPLALPLPCSGCRFGFLGVINALIAIAFRRNARMLGRLRARNGRVSFKGRKKFHCAIDNYTPRVIYAARSRTRGTFRCNARVFLRFRETGCAP